MPSPSFVYDLPRLLRVRAAESALMHLAEPALRVLAHPCDVPLHDAMRRLAVLAGSFNPLTLGHVALVNAARTAGADGMLLLLPLRAVDKEAVTRACAVDRVLTLLEWAATANADDSADGIGVALVNRGLYVEQAALLAHEFPNSELVFVVGHDKIVQIFDSRYYVERDRALDTLFGLAEFAVAPRQGAGETALRELLDSPENRAYAGRVAPLAVAGDVDVATLSSTVVRAAAHGGQPWEHLVPRATAELLHKTRPYSPPRMLPGGEMIDPYGVRLALLEAAAAAAESGRLAPGADFAALCRKAMGKAGYVTGPDPDTV